jgi:hypothetical protein
MARVRTSVSLGTVAVVVLGGLSLGLGSVMMPGSTSLGGPVVLSARPELDRPLIAAPDGTTDPGTTRTAADSGEAVGVRAPTPIRADAHGTATGGAGSYGDADGTNGTGGTGRTTTTGAGTRAATESTVPPLDSPAAGSIATSGSAPVEPAHVPKVPSRSDDLRGALAGAIPLETSGTSTLEGTRTHDQP